MYAIRSGVCARSTGSSRSPAGSPRVRAARGPRHHRSTRPSRVVRAINFPSKKFLSLASSSPVKGDLDGHERVAAKDWTNRNSLIGTVVAQHHNMLTDAERPPRSPLRYTPRLVSDTHGANDVFLRRLADVQQFSSSAIHRRKSRCRRPQARCREGQEQPHPEPHWATANSRVRRSAHSAAMDAGDPSGCIARKDWNQGSNGMRSRRNENGKAGFIQPRTNADPCRILPFLETEILLVGRSAGVRSNARSARYNPRPKIQSEGA